MKNLILPIFGLLMLWQTAVLGAAGCDLNDPDRDVKHFFPQMTNYRTEYLSIKTLGGEKLYQSVQQRYGDKFKGLYETIDVPYTVYTILKGKEIIGYIHGVNQKGKYGGLQVFLALDPRGTIIRQYFQKMTAGYAAKFRADSFSSQFIGLKLADFQKYEVVTGKFPPKIKNPAPEATDDFNAALRGTKKNLILMDIFVFNRPKEAK